jgi:F-type H+-transporting ATPase subunit beta
VFSIVVPKNRSGSLKPNFFTGIVEKMTEHEDFNRFNQGRVVSVRGSVVDAHFPRRLPLVHSLLRTGKDDSIAIEVKTHLNSELVRGVALTLTQGLARGSLIIDTGRHLNVPVGKRLLGRMFNVFGEPIDRKGEIKGGGMAFYSSKPCAHRSAGNHIRNF